MSKNKWLIGKSWYLSQSMGVIKDIKNFQQLPQKKKKKKINDTLNVFLAVCYYSRIPCDIIIIKSRW